MIAHLLSLTTQKTNPLKFIELIYLFILSSVIKIIRMNTLRRLVFATSTLAPSRGFQAIRNPTIKKQLQILSNPQLEALANVLQSLTNAEMEYLNLLITERNIKNGGSVLDNKMISLEGHQIEPISYIYQQDWIKTNWKETNLLSFALNKQIEEIGDKVQTAAVKENYDVELSSLDQAQKIKIIKALREIFSLGLKEAKDLADKTPSMLKKNIKKDEAEKLKKDLEAVGCVVTLK